MGYYEDHINAVGKRWGKQYKESGLTPEKFSSRMRKTLLSYGWSADETERIIALAIKEGTP